MAKLNTAVLPVMPLKDIVVFPNSITPLIVLRPRSLAAMEEALGANKKIMLVAQRSLDEKEPRPTDLYNVGTVSEVLQVLKLPDGTAKILVEGQYVAQVIDYLKQDSYLRGLIIPVTYDKSPSKRVEALVRTVRKQLETYAHLCDKIPEDLLLSITNIDEPLNQAHAISNYCGFKTPDKQALLEARNIEQKFFLLSQLFTQENELLELESKILTQVKSQIGKSQKEYFLNEQLKVIEKELGLSSEDELELEEFQEKIEKSKMPAEAKEKSFKELSRLSKMSPLSPEATVSRTYLEWLLEVPWGKLTQDKKDLKRAQKILDEDHYGLEKIKERILEFLAVHQLVEDLKGPILCFVGPPGVGKTSLARSIARTLGRKFVRVSLGGVRDEAEIRGHRRTYIGSLPGKIVQSLKRAKTMNPVFLLDEVDKMSADFRGDPASALLEVLDPEQNKTFSDHYLEVETDLSRVLFITTANTLDGIPHPLLDRMEMIRIPGYTEDEKRAIAEQFLIPRQIKAHGLGKRSFKIGSEALDLLITGYTREAGVRNLEREIASLCRKAARDFVTDKNKGALAQTITPERVREMLGPVRHKDLELHKRPEIGVATGLAWTEAGGELLPTETMVMDGKGNLLLTGMLGTVMQESAKAALSYIRTRAQALKIPRDFYKKFDLHIHIPEGAIPKDGPSAGITMATSIASALAKRPVRQDLAMTGEITLRGKVLKIGGLKEKILAAHRAHIATVIVPRDNEDELEEISKKVRLDMSFVLVDHMDEVLENAFAKPEARELKTPEHDLPL
ncbi:MAG: endopeptidase La, partial [bacterium]